MLPPEVVLTVVVLVAAISIVYAVGNWIPSTRRGGRAYLVPRARDVVCQVWKTWRWNVFFVLFFLVLTILFDRDRPDSGLSRWAGIAGLWIDSLGAWLLANVWLLGPRSIANDRAADSDTDWLRASIEARLGVLVLLLGFVLQIAGMTGLSYAALPPAAILPFVARFMVQQEEPERGPLPHPG